MLKLHFFASWVVRVIQAMFKMTWIYLDFQLQVECVTTPLYYINGEPILYSSKTKMAGSKIIIF